MDIYRRPATRFVAGFVGTPRMNFVPVRVGEAHRRARAHLPDGAVLDTAIPCAALPAEQQMTLGLRPEAVRVADTGNAQLRGMARVVERLGERTLVYVALADGTLLTAEDRGDSAVQPGDAVGLAVDAGVAHLFAADGHGYHGEAN